MRKYTKDHEWIDINDGIAKVGITNYAAEQLGDIVFIELPEIGAEFSIGSEAAVVESTKAASDIYAPVSGKIDSVNNEIVDNPSLVNEKANEIWFFSIKIKDENEINSLMDNNIAS